MLSSDRIRELLNLREQHEKYLASLMAEYNHLSAQELAECLSNSPGEQDFINDFIEFESSSEFANEFRKARSEIEQLSKSDDINSSIPYITRGGGSFDMNPDDPNRPYDRPDGH